MKAEEINKLRIDPRRLLQRELERRCQNNPKYSLRAFARALGMSPAGLSYVLTGKRPLSRKAAKRISNLLALAPEESMALVNWAATPRSKRASPGGGSQLDDSLPQGVDLYQLSLDSFALISDWFHYGILSLLEIPGARFEPKWIARHLGISEIEAKNAMERLERLEIIEQVGGRWRQVTGPIRIASEVPTSATRKFQKQLLLKAIESVENDPDDAKDISSMTLAMSAVLIPYAAKRIREFRRALAEELEAKATPDRVYKFTVQLFPVSQPISPKEKSK